ncbi:hypothetical protein D8674_028003 [Pyrus ussuriensis x Pyrus communis]|uniref:DUF4220 domain-containing protein n=1 Tax=Pyrus ussuriensis x Pyrus communis TaxID=2448454 RepID=A0A5N5ID18_9ROSA|nr:uncharacterized protein LOC103961896 [Pyrus x bretschneideri]XP_048438325.1 uncharacterized protein LOC103961896 [Pyrus x bretschneideri]KAB2637469.1 hypothetical protein D8674_028003 [Pyrus ussuriensis x Pyrus communis]
MTSSINPIPISVRKLWEGWNLRGFIILSLTLQTMLILCAPFRKRTPNLFLIFLVWSSYLLADWAASFAVGLISNSQGDAKGSGDNNEDLLAFWAPFLLLHLGGPDTITAFALEDNTLWLRHFLGLVFQVIAAVYVFIQSFPTNKLWPPTLLLFLAGTIKYAERTRALYCASLDNFKESLIKKPDPGPNYAKLMEEYSSKKDAKLPTRIELTAERSKESRTVTYVAEEGDMRDNFAVVRHAYHFYEIFRGLIVDLIFSFHEGFESRAFFHDRSAEETFRLIAIELNFMYEALFTKAVVVHSKLGCLFRAISFTAVFIALVFFYKLEKKAFHKVDVGITYTLLYGALCLDSIAIFLVIFSEWTVTAMHKSWQKSWVAKILGKYLSLKKPRRSTESTTCLEWCRQILFRRWCESISSFNFIHYSLKEHRKLSSNIFDYFGIGYIAIIDLFGLKDLRDKMKYRTSRPLTEGLWEFIFKELKAKSVLADDPETAKRISTARGDWILQDSEWNDTQHATLLSYVVDVDYDQSILLWHIATELCYNCEEKETSHSESSKNETSRHESSKNETSRHESSKNETSRRESSKNEPSRREISKTLSDYMLYLLVMQPSLTSSVAGIGQIRFRDTCAEAKKFFSRRELRKGGEQFEELVACKSMLEVNTDVKPADVKGDRSKSVLFDACILAKGLIKMEDKKWDLMSRVWVELLSYAACHCRAKDHAQLLSKGGELVTFVWLLMAHFGIGEQFQINEGHARAKLIVGK